MLLSPFIDIFVALSLFLGIAIGWATRVTLRKIGTGVMLLVFAGLVIASTFETSAGAALSANSILFSAPIAALAGMLAFSGAALGRQISKWSIQ